MFYLNNKTISFFQLDCIQDKTSLLSMIDFDPHKILYSRLSFFPSMK